MHNLVDSHIFYAKPKLNFDCLFDPLFAARAPVVHHGVHRGVTGKISCHRGGGGALGCRLRDGVGSLPSAVDYLHKAAANFKPLPFREQAPKQTTNVRLCLQSC